MAAERTHDDYEELYRGDVPPPWEIGRPQPALIALLDRMDLDDPILDVGCGTGELAIHLARKGHRVVGIDFSEAGIATARSKAVERGVDVSFDVVDARRLQELDLRPRTVVDSGLLHSIDDETVSAYVAGLETICDSGALVCILAVKIEAGVDWGVTREGLTETFSAPAWVDTNIEPADVHAAWDGEELHLSALLMTTMLA